MAESTSPDRIPLTIEVTPAQKRQIERLAEKKGLSPEAIVLSLLDRELETVANGEEAEEPKPGSFLEATRDLAGAIDDPDAPHDLSYNPKHMEGYGQ
jgi:hypothetical protein